MGLAAFLAALHILSRPQGRLHGQRDPEKAEPRNGCPAIQRDEHLQGAHRESSDCHELDQDDDDDADIDDEFHVVWRHFGRRMRRFTTWSSASTFHRFKRSPTSATSSSTTSLLSKLRSYIYPREENDAEIERFLPNYRYSPLISGIIIPFSILLEIPGLTERWYIQTLNNKTVDTRPNPIILDVGLGVSIACALLANICLIMRFLERWIKPTTLLCIFFLTAHDTINIIAVTIFGVEHHYDDGFTYGQAFWMTLCSTIVSTITNINLISDYIRVPDFADSGSGLTRKQRALVIIVILLLLYIAFGALANSLLLHLSYIDGLYYTTISIETIGFGDVVPTTTGGRVFICIYVALGIVALGMVVTMCRDTVLEGLEVGYRKRVRNMRARRRDARRFRRWRARWRAAIEWRLREKGCPVWISDEQWQEAGDGVRFVGLGGEMAGVGERRWVRRFLYMVGIRSVQPPADVAMRPPRHVRGYPRGKHLNLNALTDGQLEAAALEAGVPLEMFVDLGKRREASQRRAADNRTESDPQSVGAGAAPVMASPRFNAAHTTEGPFVTNGWPMDVQTPTHAQLGRMAAMVTQMALANNGSNVNPRGFTLESQTMLDENANKIENDTSQRPERSSQTERNNSVQDGENHGHQGTFSDIGRYVRIPRWVRETVHGANQGSAFSYETLKAEMANEEKKAYYAKLTIAWTLFLVFWFVGSGIFSATEGWSYGIALYFCFISFTTVGYGDYAPETPAGRSVFVVWALFGVATVTILFSVIQEAGSNRYKSVLHSRVFDKAVERYRKTESREAAKVPRIAETHLHRTTSNINKSERARKEHRNGNLNASGGPASGQSSATVTSTRLKRSQEIAQRELEILPGEILRQARTFHDYIQYFMNTIGSDYEDVNLPGEEGRRNVPAELKKLLDDILEVEGVGERVKREILQDDESKNTLFMLSIERALKRIIQSAERALAALAHRDALMALEQTQVQENLNANKSAQDTNEQVDSPSAEQNSTPIPEATAPSVTNTNPSSATLCQPSVVHKSSRSNTFQGQEDHGSGHGS
ncbi:hypothetical protein AcW1_001803 [Taiwanofungus camphoratus]|nr:hypothetical protein AcW1_001803 [Antrodia cinnamomea]